MSMVPADSVSFVPANIDRAKVLRAFNIDASDPKAQAMLLACEKYGLDPLLKHAILIKGNLYVTRDGLLHVAHKSGRLDGIVVDEEGADAQEWWAKVTVYVKGQTHGYSYRGRYPKSGQQKQYGPEMAVKVAEVMALRRAFGVTGLPTVEEQWDKSDAVAASSAPRPPLPHEIEAGQSPSPEGSSSGGVPATAPEAARPEHAGTPEVLHQSPGGERQVPPPDALPLGVDVGSGGGTAASSGSSGEPRSPSATRAPDASGEQVEGSIPETPSGPVTLGDLLNRMEGKAAATRKGRLLKVATEIAKEHTWPAPATVDDIDERLLGAIAAGLPAEDPRASQRRWMHATWGLNGGNEARKDAISRLTSGRTDSSSDLTADEWREFMTATGALPVQLPPREEVA